MSSKDIVLSIPSSSSRTRTSRTTWIFLAPRTLTIPITYGTSFLYFMLDKTSPLRVRLKVRDVDVSVRSNVSIHWKIDIIETMITLKYLHFFLLLIIFSLPLISWVVRTKEQWTLERKSQEVFVNPYTVELAKNGTNVIWRYSKNKQFLFHAQGHGSKVEPATTLWSL